MSARSPEDTHALIAAAFNAGDLDAFLEIYEENATVIAPPEGRRVTGTDAIRSAVAPTFALAPSASIEVVEKLQTDGLALTHARWSLVGSDGGEARGDVGARNDRLAPTARRQLAHRPRQPHEPGVIEPRRRHRLAPGASRRSPTGHAGAQRRGRVRLGRQARRRARSVIAFPRDSPEPRPCARASSPEAA
jgi:uncharacterized protein (TIGR02246 family)